MNRLGFASALTGFLAVALGAFGAHALGENLTAKASGWWDTATLYALVHSAAALATSLTAGAKGTIKFGGWAFITGSWLFAGSLYAMALGGPSILGAVTPLGGASLLVGWMACAYDAVKA